MAIPATYGKYYERRLSEALQRADSAKHRVTSTLAREFFENDDNEFQDRRLGIDNASSWRSLPRRLAKLAAYLEDPSSVTNGGTDSFPVQVSHDINESRRAALSAAIFVQAPATFLDQFRSLFEALLNAHQRIWTRQNNELHHLNELTFIDTLTDEEKIEEDTLLLKQEEQLCQALNILRWIPNQLHLPFREALHSVMLRVVKALISSNFESEGMLERILQWKNAVLVPWVYNIIGPETYARDQWEAQLEYAASECFVHVRMNELFELVTEYPESQPAVRELSAALERTGRLLYHSLANKWRTALMQRLIHPGAQTSQIIDVYISTIKVLREMDPSGELLDMVTQPVRRYLREREDTVRCIITSLTDEEGGGDLYEELRRHDAKPLEEAQLDEEDDEEPPSFDWEPQPSILQRRGVITGQLGRVASSSRHAGDILSMLVGIYGSKELFVNEYRIILADKLLSNLEYNTDKEVHNLELLKLRFGEVSMSQCEVMIKDIDDSKRINTNIKSTLQAKYNEDDPPVVDAAIVSHIFWPALQKDQLKHHPLIQSKLDDFGTEYAKLKNPRRLMWIKQLGTVELEVEVYENDSDGNLITHKKEVTCSPTNATLLAHFGDKGSWTAEELSIETETPEEVVRKRMAFWVNQRVVQLHRSGSNFTYTLLSVNECCGSDQSFVDHDDDEQENAVSLGAHEEEEMKIFESYIVGMLSNLGQLSIERIHTMLKTFAAGSDHKYDKSSPQLALFLRQLCKEEKLECSPDGLYKLLKKRS